VESFVFCFDSEGTPCRSDALFFTGSQLQNVNGLRGRGRSLRVSAPSSGTEFLSPALVTGSSLEAMSILNRIMSAQSKLPALQAFSNAEGCCSNTLRDWKGLSYTRCPA
jgi:hypothetical protein